MNCADLEKSSQNAASPGVVANAEVVARGVIAPDHFNKSGIKVAFVRPAHLVTCELSVWRTAVREDFGVPEAQEMMANNLKESQQLTAVLGAEAGEIRGIRIEQDPERQIFCVVDDARTDEVGGVHPCHATLGLNDASGDWQQGSERFIVAVEGLRALFVKRHLWPAEAA